MLTAIRVLLAGESYWKVRMSSGKELSELDTKPVELARTSEILTGDGRIVTARKANLAPHVLVRRLEWKEDLIDSGDIRHVKEVMLCTPKGTAHLSVTEPYTAFQFSRGTMALDAAYGQTVRLKNAQIAGVVTDKDTGECEYACWDVQAQELYTGITSVYEFHAWREGVIPIGALNLAVMDVRLT